MAVELEERVRSLESKFYLGTGAFAVFALWMGYTSFFSIPKDIDENLKSTTTKEMTAKITKLYEESKNNATLIAQMGSSGSMNVAGSCFKPRILYRCFGKPRGGDDHMTWFDNKDECLKAGFNVEAEVAVLAAC